MNWNEFAKEVHQVAVEHGWWVKRPSFAEIVVMLHSELSEAVEEYRRKRPMVYCEGMDSNVACREEPCEGMECLRNFPDRKPEGVAVELADCILRILDFLADNEVDIDGAIGFSPADTDVIPAIARCHGHISAAYMRTTDMEGIYARMIMCIETIMTWANANGVDMEAIMRLKHEYNKSRPYRHGGKRI